VQATDAIPDTASPRATDNLDTILQDGSKCTDKARPLPLEDLAFPLVNLTRKGTPFTWQEEQEQIMQSLKTDIVQSPILISIDYNTDHTIYLSVDSSVRSV
jgi:hypothetical protein